MEKLGQLRAEAEREGTWDLIVVDTPPTPVGAGLPGRPEAARVVPGRAVHPAARGARPRPAAGPTSRCSAPASARSPGALTKVLGAQVLKDVQTFVAALDTMFGGFRERADATYQLLQEPGTAFVVVAAPERDALREASYFVERLASEGMPLAGLVLNRVHDAGRAGAVGGARAGRGRDPRGGRGEPARRSTAAGVLRLHAERMRIDRAASSRCARGSPRRTPGAGRRRAGPARRRARPGGPARRSAPRWPAADAPAARAVRPPGTRRGVARLGR